MFKIENSSDKENKKFLLLHCEVCTHLVRQECMEHGRNGIGHKTKWWFNFLWHTKFNNTRKNWDFVILFLQNLFDVQEKNETIFYC